MTKQLLEQSLDFCKALSFTEGYESKVGKHSDLETHIKALEAAIASWGDDAALYQSRLGVKHDGQVTFERWFVCSKSQYDYHVHNKGADNNWVYEARKLYTHPAPKQVPMSDEELATLKHRAALYEHIRKFNPVKFNEFYSRNIKGGGAFDDLVYQDLVKEQSL